MSRRLAWLRFLAEGAVIVGSILLAFAIQAWWEERGDSLRREALREALRSDMTAAGAEVQRVLRFHLAGRDAAATLLNLGAEGRLSPDQAHIVDSLIAVVYASPSYDAPLGALDALLGSGQLEVLEDADLALALTAFPALVADLNREQSLLPPLLSQLDAYLIGNGVDTSHLNATTVPWPTSTTRAFSLVGEVEFRGPLRAMWYRYRNSSQDLGQMRDAIEAIEARLATSR